MPKTLKIITKSDAETKKLGAMLAKTILKTPQAKGSFVISLEGELGSGKTTFTQGFARGLRVKEIPKSPTFVIMQIYKIPRTHFAKLVHVDAYRLNLKDFKALNWSNFVSDQKNLILVEWGNKIKNILPKCSLTIFFGHVGHFKKRLIKIKI